MTAEPTSYFQAVEAAQTHKVAAGQARTKDAALAQAQAALGQYRRAEGLAVSPAGKRFAQVGAEQAELDLEAYRDPQLWEVKHWSEWGRGAEGRSKGIRGFAR